MKRKTKIIILFAFMFLILGYSIYYTTSWFIVNQVPFFYTDEPEEEYVSYEDGGQKYGIDAIEMVKIINIVASRE